MPRGGNRAGAGRPRGSATKRTRAIADHAAREGVAPLEVMLEAMRAYHTAGDLADAVEVAHLAAPYCHPRLAAVELTGRDGADLFRKMSDEELDRRLAEAGAALATE